MENIGIIIVSVILATLLFKVLKFSLKTIVIIAIAFILMKLLS